MTPEQQRIAIAEACGWTWTDGSGDYCIGWIHDNETGRQLSEHWNGKRTKEECSDLLPDYPNDLNAMHKAEVYKEFHCYPLREKYYPILIGICNRKGGDSYPLWMATAAQRAEAFLRTLGKWENSY